jgi:hypothetical protein
MSNKKLKLSTVVWKMAYDKYGDCDVTLEYFKLDDLLVSECLSCKCAINILHNDHYSFLEIENCPVFNESVIELGRIKKNCRQHRETPQTEERALKNKPLIHGKSITQFKVPSLILDE